MNPFPLGAPVRERVELLSLQFLAEFYAEETRRHPGNLCALGELGTVLTRLGRLEEGLEVDRTLVSRAPRNPTAHYNLGCSLALLGRCDEALDALERAVELGYADPDFLAADEDLYGLRAEPRFQELLRRLRERAPS